MSTEITLEHNFYDIANSGHIIGLSKSLVNGQQPGILGTIDSNGVPRMRWMSTLSFDEFPVFHSLTAPDSRKVLEIKAHPQVSWMFFNADKSLVLNLRGKATIIAETSRLKQIWRRIVDTSHAYFLNQYTKKPGFVVIETLVESIECSSPENALRFEIDPVGLVRKTHPRSDFRGDPGSGASPAETSRPPL